MEIRCPFCHYHIVVKGAKAGGYRPVCPRCKDPFVMVIALVEGQRLVLLGETLETLRPVKRSEVAKAAAAPGATPAAAASEDATVARSAETASEDEASTPPRAPREAVLVDDDATRAAPPSRSVAPPDPFPARPASSDREEVTAAGVSPAPARTVDHATGKTPPGSPAGSSTARAAARGELTGRLDGFEIVRMLGRGGMGSVHLARQLSLDRLVALKTINPEWAENPVFLSRFTREAYAAAQLTHHNVVQIYDIDEDRSTHFFSMEYVQGQSLADVLKEKGRLDAEEAAGYILHAARGLKFAHDHQMVHRDVKPANLLVNDQGIVKVADLGLVKTAAGDDDLAGLPTSHGRGRLAGSGSQTAHSAMGTPAYMAPEQVVDAANVDGRADIYSLGATFYALATGRPLFEGNTPDEVMTKHVKEPVTPPENFARRVPKAVSAVILKMLQKRPEDRYQDLGEVIRALESFLGIAAGPFTPREEHAEALEGAVRGFNGSMQARLRRWLILAFFALCLAGAVFGAVTARPVLFAASLLLLGTTMLCYPVLTGITQKTFLFRKLRQLVFGARLRDWVAWLGAIAVGVAIVVILGLLPALVGVLVAGAVLAAAFHFTIDLLVRKDREPYLNTVRDLLKGMRLRGLEEEALRRFVCKYSGRHWEAFYEALFGYEAKIDARTKWGRDDDGKPRRKHGTWRDGIIAWIDARQQARAEAKQRRHLQKIEARRLKAEGRSEQEATRVAERMAETMVDRAQSYRQTGEWKPVAVKDETEAQDAPRRLRPGVVGRLMALLLGGRMRAAVGAGLLIVYGLWVRRTRLAEQLDADADLQTARSWLRQDRPPLDWPGVPTEVMQVLCSHGAGLAGLALLASAVFRGKKMTAFMLPAVVVLLGARFVPEVTLPVVSQYLSPTELVLAVGALLALAGLRFGRHRF